MKSFSSFSADVTYFVNWYTACLVRPLLLKKIYHLVLAVLAALPTLQLFEVAHMMRAFNWEPRKAGCISLLLFC